MHNRHWFKEHLNSNEGQNRDIINMKKEQNRMAIREHKDKLLKSKQDKVKETRFQSNDALSLKNRIFKD